MAICDILKDPSQTEQQAAQILARVLSTSWGLPTGARLFLSGPANPGWRVITVWDTPQARDKFYAEQLAPAYQTAGLSLDSATRTDFDISMLIAGDLVGAPQPE